MVATNPVRALALTAVLVVAGCSGQTGTVVPKPFGRINDLDDDAQEWVDETLASLSLEELVGQLVIEWIPGGYVSPSSPDFEPLETWVVTDKIGGVSPSIGTPHAYVAKLNALQERAEIPLLITADFENGGPGMRINGSYALPSMLPQGGGTSFPPTMAFGAVNDERFAFEYGRITAVEARATGVHLLFSPVLDVNNNPDNPVIASRSYGADPQLVARMGAAFIRGAKEGGAFTTGKHFPGHGDTSVDSHVDLPVIPADRARLDAVELVPFDHAIQAGVDAIMTAHVALPEILGVDGPPATLSPDIMTGLLRADLAFDGVLFTDAMTMGAITDAYGIGEASVRAVEAGSDVILSPKDVSAAINAVVAAVNAGRINRRRLENSARRLLEMKAKLGLHRNRFVSLDAVDDVVGSGAHLAFADTAAARSMTLVQDDAGLVPMRAEDPVRTVHVRYAPSTWLWANRAFAAGLLSRVPSAREVRIDERSDEAAYEAAAAAVEGADRVIVSVYLHTRAGSGADALPERFSRLVNSSARQRPTVLLSFASPYLVRALPDVSSYMVAWGDREVSQRAAVAALFGEEAITGRLPIQIPPLFDLGHGLNRDKVTTRVVTRVVDDPLVAAGIVARTGEGGISGQDQTVADPASVGMSSEGLARVDSIIRAGLDDSAFSGATVAIGRHGRLVKLDAYGELAYGSGRPTTTTSIWDMASVSKVVGTTTAAMMLVGDGALDLDAPVVQYLPWWSRGDERKNQITVRQLLIHRTGLPPFRRWFFDHEGLEAYKNAAADEPLDMDPGLETIYSDIGIMTLAWVIEEVSGQTLDALLQERLWDPLGMAETRYRPDASLKPRIAATEVDTLWRDELVWGRVHDENADAMGGVAGHAGLFSTAVDLSVFAQMTLNGGESPACQPGDDAGVPCPLGRGIAQQIVDPGVLSMFTTRFDETSTRGLGWDTPGERSSGGDYVTSSAFGHTGYTGTSIWMDPELDVWVILLTNRVHPSRENSKHVPLRRAVADAALLAITDQPVRKRTP